MYPKISQLTKRFSMACSQEVWHRNIKIFSGILLQFQSKMEVKFEILKVHSIRVGKRLESPDFH